jgi:hypothetical protein
VQPEQELGSAIPGGAGGDGSTQSGAVTDLLSADVELVLGWRLDCAPHTHFHHPWRSASTDRAAYGRRHYLVPMTTRSDGIPLLLPVYSRLHDNCPSLRLRTMRKGLVSYLTRKTACNVVDKTAIPMMYSETRAI